MLSLFTVHVINPLACCSPVSPLQKVDLQTIFLNTFVVLQASLLRCWSVDPAMGLWPRLGIGGFKLGV